MVGTVLVDTGFLVALLGRRDANHPWAAAQAQRSPPPWATCEAVLSESVHLLGASGAASLTAIVRRGAVLCRFQFNENVEAVLKLMDKYADVPISFADACLVRMTETLNDPVLLTTDADFQIYRRHGRQSIPCMFPL
jgi:predicted nucleic acid-binding protein